MINRQSFLFPLHKACILGVFLLASTLSAQAIDVDLDVDGKPEEACLATEKTLRMIMNIWANQALDTYGQIKPDLRKGLESHGERGSKLLPVFDAMMIRIENGEFLPPKVLSRFEGHQKLRAAAHTECMAAIAK